MSSISITEYAIVYPKNFDNATLLLKKDTVYKSPRTWRYLINADLLTSIDSDGKRCAWYKRGNDIIRLHHSAVNSISYSDDPTEKTW